MTAVGKLLAWLTAAIAGLGAHSVKPPVTVSLAPTSVLAGGHASLGFAFTATDLVSAGTVSIVVPNPTVGTSWSAPQTGNPTAPGYVTVSRAGCLTPGDAMVTGTGPWVISVRFACVTKKTFTVTYGSGSGQAVSPTATGVSTFETGVTAGGQNLATATQPSVTVTPGPAARLVLGTPNSVAAGEPLTGTITALDAYGNVATGYRDTVHVASSDAQAVIPSDISFTAADAGTHTLTGGGAPVMKTAGAQSVSVTDLSVAALTSSVPVTVNPGPVAKIAVDVTLSSNGDINAGTNYDLQGPIGSCGATASDAYGNILPNAKFTWTFTDPLATIAAGFPAYCSFYTVGPETVTVSSPVDPANPAGAQVTGTKAFAVVGGARAYPNDITVSDPTHSYGVSAWTLDVLDNDQEGDVPYVRNIFLRYFNTISAITQPTYVNSNGDTVQVGEMDISSDLHYLVWDLNPPTSVSPADPNATLLRCPPDATGTGVCHVPENINASYTLTDGANYSTAPVTLHLDTADTPATPSQLSGTPTGAVPAVHCCTVTNGTTSADLSVDQQISIPIGEKISLSPAAGMPSDPVPAGSVTLNLGPLPTTLVAPPTTQTEIAALVAGTGQISATAETLGTPPLTGSLTEPVSCAVESANLADVWKGGNPDDPRNNCLAYTYLSTSNDGTPATGMTPVQINALPSPEGADAPVNTEYSVLTLAFNIDASLCTSNATGGCGTP